LPIFKVKAFFGGRKGSPLLINYYTLSSYSKRGRFTAPARPSFSSWDRWSPCAAAMVLLFLPIAGHAPVFLLTGM
jgi:hypothetical protein